MKAKLSFILFLAVFFTLYGSLHYYFYWHLKSALTIRSLYNWVVIIFLFFMLITPVLVNVFAKQENGLPVTFLAYIGYTWMGALFLFFSIHILIDIYKGIIYFSYRVFSPLLIRFMPENKASFILTVLIVTGIIIYGTFEASRIRVETVALKTEKLPPGINRLRIVQISDIHFSIINDLKLARKIADKIKNLNPDILVSTGDMIDRGIKEKERITELFRDIKTPLGKYAVMGNHEFYAGVGKSVEFIRKAGFRMLRNEGTTAGRVVNIAGMDDPAAKRLGLDGDVSEDKVLQKLSNEKLTILLKHQPRISENSLGMFDLQLSGHTHNGQIFPFTLVVSFFFPYHNGLIMLDKHSSLYVSRGTGTWGPPMRLGSRNEITLLQLR